MWIDNFSFPPCQKTGINRRIDYLRLSVTDRCNLRCIYCMPKEGIISKPQKAMLTFEEIVRLTRIFASIGIRKIRLTGGEPLVRKGIIYLIQSLAKIRGVEEILLTTNGVLLPFYAERLKKAGIKRINISLDTLDGSKFQIISGSDFLYNILEGIEKVKGLGFNPIKLNTVIMKGVNDDEILDFVKFSLSKGLILRFIEFMNVTPLWRKEYYISIEKMWEAVGKRFKLKRVGPIDSSPAQYYKVENGGLIGFIKTDENNCRNCNRLRLTATGELRICLYEEKGVSIKGLLRTGLSDERIRDIILTKMCFKKDTNYKDYESEGLYMCNIGG